MSLRNLLSILSLCAVATTAAGCFDIDDYIKIIHEEEPDPLEPEHPDDAEDIPEQDDDETKKPSGSGGIIDSTDDDSTENTENNGEGGEVIIPETLTIQSITPSTGDIAGGYEIRLRGTLLEDSGQVRFGTIDAPTQIYVNNKVVRATVPSGKKGCVDVSWSQGESTVTLPNGFCYTQAISLEAISPNTAEQNHSTEIEVTGSGFDEDTHVYFIQENGDSLPIVAPQITSESRIRGILPNLELGSISIAVANRSSLSRLENALVVTPELQLTSLSPRVIDIDEQTTIVAEGSGFDENTRLRIAGVDITPTLDSDKKLHFTAPKAKIGVYDALIYSQNRQQRLNNALRFYEDDGSAQILSISPDSGSSSGGEAVQISGIHLPTTSVVRFGDVNANVSSMTENTWNAITPAHDAGFVDVTLGDVTLQNAYQYRHDGDFHVTSVTPLSTPMGEETTITVTGFHFTADMRASFGPWEATQIRLKSENEAEIDVPQGAGSVPLVISQDEDAQTFTFTYLENVELTALSPSQSVINGQTQIEVYGSGFTKDMKIRIAGQEIPIVYDYAGHISFEAPAHEVGTDTVELLCGDSVCDSTEMSWFDPTGIVTGASGTSVHGQVHVTVLTTDTAVPIANATVYVGPSLDGAVVGKTDENGRVSFFNDALEGAQIVMACAPQYACNTLQPVDASHVTLLLEKWTDSSQTDDSETEENPPQENEGNIINPIEIVVPYTPTQPYFVGTIGDLAKDELYSDPNVVQAAYIMQSALSTHVLSHDKEDVYVLFESNSSYKIKARKGNNALAVLCGRYNIETHAFTPSYIGVKRHLFVNDGDRIANHLECNIPLNQTQSFKLLDAPLHSGPNVVVGTAYIDLGEEGYIGGFMHGYSTTDNVVITGLPPLRDTLEDASFAVSVGAYTNYSSPSTVFYEYNVTLQETPIEVGPAAPIPRFQTTNTENVLKTRQILWNVEYPQNVDMYALSLRMYGTGEAGYRPYAQFYLPGSATSAELPPNLAWPETGNGTLYIQLTAYKSVRNGFDFNLFSTAELRYNYIHSSATSSLAISYSSLVDP